MEIRTVRAEDWNLLKQLTLQSLIDAPYAFGGEESFEEESTRPDSMWQQLAAECAGDVPEWRDRCVGYLVMIDGEACGKALCFLSTRNPKLALFSAMWIDPRHRRRGIGQKVMEAAIAWASAHAAERLKLWVDGTNPGGAAFYRAVGFEPTGESRPVVPNSMNLEHSFTLMLKPG